MLAAILIGVISRDRVVGQSGLWCEHLLECSVLTETFSAANFDVVVVCFALLHCDCGDIGVVSCVHVGKRFVTR